MPSTMSRPSWSPEPESVTTATRLLSCTPEDVKRIRTVVGFAITPVGVRRAVNAAVVQAVSEMRALAAALRKRPWTPHTSAQFRSVFRCLSRVGGPMAAS